MVQHGMGEKLPHYSPTGLVPPFLFGVGVGPKSTAFWFCSPLLLYFFIELAFGICAYRLLSASLYSPLVVGFEKILHIGLLSITGFAGLWHTQGRDTCLFVP